MRVPNWLYVRMERIYMDERRIRREEANQRLADEDRRLREWANRKSVAHDSGMCGGAAAGCPFVPCVPFVGWGG